MSSKIDAMHDCATKIMKESGGENGVDNLPDTSQVATQRPEAEKSKEERGQGQEVPCHYFSALQAPLREEAQRRARECGVREKSQAVMIVRWPVDG